MTKPTRKELWAFYVGFAVAGMVFGYFLGIPSVFLINGLICALDIYMYTTAGDK